MSRDEEEMAKMLREIPDGTPDSDHVDDGLLIAYVRGTIDEARREDIDRHLTSCADCRALVADYGDPISPETKAWAKEKLATGHRRRWPVATGVAVAAAVLLFAFLPRPKTDTDRVPEYEIAAMLGGVAKMRGPAVGGGVFVPTSRVRWILRPTGAKMPDAHLRVFVARGDRIVEVATPAYDRGASGTIRFESNAEDLLGREFGARIVHFAVVSKIDDGPLFAGARDALELGPHRWLTSRVEYRAQIPKEENQ